MSLYCEKCYEAAVSAKKEAEQFKMQLNDEFLVLFLTRNRSNCGCPNEFPEELRMTDAEVRWFMEAWEFDMKDRRERERSAAGIVGDTTTTPSDVKIIDESMEDGDPMENEEKENVAPTDQKSSGTRKTRQKRVKRVKRETRRQRPYVSRMDPEKREKIEKERGNSATDANILKILQGAREEIRQEEESNFDVYGITGFD